MLKEKSRNGQTIEVNKGQMSKVFFKIWYRKYIYQSNNIIDGLKKKKKTVKYVNDLPKKKQKIRY